MSKKVVHSVFENIATQYPENVAVQSETAQINYRNLNEFSNEVAHILHEFGIEKGAPIGLLMPTGMSYVSAILGVSKASAVFVPLETAHPPKRTKFILENVKIKYLITTPEQLEANGQWLQEIDLLTDIIVIKGEQSGELELKDKVGKNFPHQLSKANPPLNVDADDPVYILHTSGSTGTPKAIVGRHKSLSHFIHWEMKEFGITVEDVVSQLATVSFDVSLRDIFLPLLAGGILCIPSEETRKNPLELLKWMGNFEITLSHMVPSIFRLLVDELTTDKTIRKDLKSLKYILLAGEPLYAEDVNNWRTAAGPDVELVNLYGPTETTLAKIFNRIKTVPAKRKDIVSLGNPISHTAVLILNNDKLCEVGQPGEICIKTPFRSLGYLNNDVMNREKFIQNPLHDEFEDIIYRTGDIGRYNSSREVEFITRKDNQVKIMGNRVELGEVTAAMEEIKGLQQPFVVSGKDGNDNQCLICYTLKNEEFDEMYVRTELKNHLPIYMHPAHFVEVDEYPTTLSGKIDKKNLPKPFLSKVEFYDEPVGDIEKKLEIIWCEILGVSRVSRGASFFNLGGSSLKAIQIISKVQKEFGVLIKIAELFALATIESLAKTIGNSVQSKFMPIPKVKEQDYYELSHSQRRLLFIEMMDETNKSNILENFYKINGDLKVDMLQKAMNKLIERHEILRTVFVEFEGEFKQKVLHLESPYEIKITKLEDRANEEQAVEEWTNKILDTSFDLGKFPLIKVEVFQLSSEKSLLSIIAHHIIFDGWSGQVFREEIMKLYKAEVTNSSTKLPELKVQYKDYAAWQNEHLLSKDNKSANFWKQQFKEEVERLDLQNKHPRPATMTFKGAYVQFQINKKLTQNLKKVSKENDATLFMTLLTLLNVLMAKYSCKDDIVIGTPIAGREHEELNSQIGVFINILPLRVKLDPDDTLGNLLQKVKMVTSGAYEHQDYPFDYLVDELDLPKDLSRSPLFDVMMVLYEQVNQKTLPLLDNLSIDFLNKRGNSSRYDMNFEFVEADDEIQVNIRYNIDLFTKKYIEQLRDYFLHITDLFSDKQDVILPEFNALPQEVVNELIAIGTGPQVELPRVKVIDMFHEIVTKNNAKVAVEAVGESMTYGELNFKANQLAVRLANSGIKTGDVVATLLLPSIDLVTAILAIFKTNATLLILDPNDPIARNILKTDKADVQIVVSDFDKEEWESLKNINIRAISEDIVEDFNYRSSKDNFIQYILFTSGTSGEPKAVKVGAVGYANYIHWANEYVYDGESGYDNSIITAFTFDHTFHTLMTTLTRGDALLLYETKDISADLQDLFFSKRHFKTADLSPSHISMLDVNETQTTAVERIVLGGEALTTSHCEKLRSLNPNMLIYNLYGPTEATISCIASVVSESSEVTIGKPINNMEAYILDDQGNLLPKGATGELYVAGSGVAQGYLKDESLTSKKFVKIPFSDYMAYRTGDLCRWNDANELIYVARADEQVKINGVRVEIAEVQNIIIAHDKVTEAVVTTADRLGRDILVAGFVGECSTEELRAYLAAQLPINMIPTALAKIEEIPLTTNSKTDIRRIRQLACNEVVVERVAPQTATEIKLTEIWKNVLNVEQVGLNEVFFDMGGQSIKAAQLKVRILKEFGLDLPLTAIFRKPTVGLLALEIDALNWASNKGAKVDNTKELII